MKIRDSRLTPRLNNARHTSASGKPGLFRALLEKEVAPVANATPELAATAETGQPAAISLAFEAADLLDTALRRLANNQAADADLLKRLNLLRSELSHLHIEDFDEMNTLIAVESERLRSME